MNLAKYRDYVFNVQGRPNAPYRVDRKNFVEAIVQRVRRKQEKAKKWARTMREPITLLVNVGNYPYPSHPMFGDFMSEAAARLIDIEPFACVLLGDYDAVCVIEA